MRIETDCLSRQSSAGTSVTLALASDFMKQNSTKYGYDWEEGIKIGMLTINREWNH